MKNKWLLAAAALWLAGCAQNPMTGRSQLMLVSENSVISQAKLAYAQELDPWQKKGKIDNDPATKARIERITGRLVAQAIRYRPETADWDWQVAVIDDPETLNAYCLPGGRMAIYTGLIRKLHATDDEIAQVMGHEIGHALANHGAEKMSQAMLAQGAVMLAGMASSDRNRGAVMTGGTALAQVGWLLPNSRQAETEADTIGIELAARAGYDPAAGASLWRKMIAASGGKSPPQWLSTHPASEARMQNLARLAAYEQPIYAEAKASPPPVFPLSGNRAAPDDNGAQSLALAPRPTMMTTAYAAFRSGQARLNCADCARQFGIQAADLRRYYQARDWEALAHGVLATDYRQDIAWFYLGAAAEGMGLREPARTYYAEAVRLAGEHGGRCAGRKPDLCGGIDLPRAGKAALERMNKGGAA